MRKIEYASWAAKAAELPVLQGEEYPRGWKQYVGQEPAKRMLQVAAASARMRGEPLDHVLISHGSPGVGKTALAYLIAKELKRPCRVVTGPVPVGWTRGHAIENRYAVAPIDFISATSSR